MRRTGGVIPPGKAGLIILAVGLAPVALAACKPLVRAVGRFLRKAGEAAERVVDNSQISVDKEAPASAAEPVKEAPKKTESKKAEPKKSDAKKSAPKAAKKAQPKAPKAADSPAT